MYSNICEKCGKQFFTPIRKRIRCYSCHPFSLSFKDKIVRVFPKEKIEEIDKEKN